MKEYIERGMLYASSFVNGARKRGYSGIYVSKNNCAVIKLSDCICELLCPTDWVIKDDRDIYILPNIAFVDKYVIIE
jgi:hypothetical protein